MGEKGPIGGREKREKGGGWWPASERGGGLVLENGPGQGWLHSLSAKRALTPWPPSGDASSPMGQGPGLPAPVVLRLECASRSPVGFVKTHFAKPNLQI